MLSEADAQLMALKQSVKLSRARLENAIDELEDLTDGLVLPAQAKRIKDVVLSLQYIIDFILGDSTP